MLNSVKIEYNMISCLSLLYNVGRVGWKVYWLLLLMDGVVPWMVAERLMIGVSPTLETDLLVMPSGVIIMMSSVTSTVVENLESPCLWLPWFNNNAMIGFRDQIQLNSD